MDSILKVYSSDNEDFEKKMKELISLIDEQNELKKKLNIVMSLEFTFDENKMRHQTINNYIKQLNMLININERTIKDFQSTMIN